MEDSPEKILFDIVYNISSFERVANENASNSSAHVNFDIEEFEFPDDLDIFNYRLAYKFSLPLVLIAGILTNPLPLTILIRRRMWLRHEGYLYLTAYLVANTLLLAIVCLPKALYFFDEDWHIADTAEATCKIWSFLAHIVVSSDWLLVALLADVYLRRHLLAPATKFGCRNFAAKYCTLFGAKFVTALTYVASVLVNWWCLVAAHLFLYDGDRYICHLSVIWYEELWLWRFVSLCVTQYIPVVIVTPMLCMMIVFANRGRVEAEAETDVIDGAVEDDRKQLTRLSIGVAGAAFLLKAPHYLLEMVIQTRRLWFYAEIAIAWYATEFIMSTQLFLLPGLCIAMLPEVRAVIRSLRLDRFGHRRF